MVTCGMTWHSSHFGTRGRSRTMAPSQAATIWGTGTTDQDTASVTSVHKPMARKVWHGHDFGQEEVSRCSLEYGSPWDGSTVHSGSGILQYKARNASMEIDLRLDDDGKPMSQQKVGACSCNQGRHQQFVHESFGHAKPTDLHIVKNRELCMLVHRRYGLCL